jgi:3-oxoacyl-[acyl-carrier-protein] synthase III
VRTPDISIRGLGVFLPDTVSVDWAVHAGLYPPAEVDLHELTGAAVAGDTPAPEMALRAARTALARCGQDAEGLDLLLYADSWHQGPDGWQPQYYLQRHLPCAGALAVEIRQGCNGMFSALELAASYLRADPSRSAALVVAADNFGTPLMNRWRMGPGYIAGDGACAVVIGPEPGFARLLSVCSTAVPEAEELHRSGEPLFPPGATVGRAVDFNARSADYRRRAVVEAFGTASLMAIQRQMLQIVEQATDEAGVRVGDIARVAFMHYAREIVEQRCMVALGLPMSRSTWEYGRTVGHLGASDQVVALDHLLATGQLGPGDHLLMVGVGPGVTLSAAVVGVLQRPPWLGSGERERAGVGGQ